jgi:hypothetical protein
MSDIKGMMYYPKIKMRDARNEIRTAVANYIDSEGCSCCRGSNHEKDMEILAKLLKVPKYKDGSGYDFSKFVKR